MHKVTRISRELFNSCRGDKSKYKALAFAIRFKALMASSTVKGYTIDKMAKIMHCSYKSVTKYMNILEDMGIIRWFYRGNVKYMHMRPLRHGKMLRTKNQDIKSIKTHVGGKLNCFTPKRMDVVLVFKAFDRLNMTQTAHLLQEYYLCEVASHKAFLMDSIGLTKKRKNGSYNNQRRVSGCSIAEIRGFVDYGISHERIAREMGVSKSTATKLIKEACTRNLVLKCRRVFYGALENVDIDPAYKMRDNFHICYTKNGQQIAIASNIYLPYMNGDWYRSMNIASKIRSACIKSQKHLLQKTILSSSLPSCPTNSSANINISPLI